MRFSQQRRSSERASQVATAIYLGSEAAVEFHLATAHLQPLLAGTEIQEPPVDGFFSWYARSPTANTTPTCVSLIATYGSSTR